LRGDGESLREVRLPIALASFSRVIFTLEKLSGGGESLRGVRCPLDLANFSRVKITLENLSGGGESLRGLGARSIWLIFLE
jgi:hypothetical protein